KDRIRLYWGPTTGGYRIREFTVWRSTDGVNFTPALNGFSSTDGVNFTPAPNGVIGDLAAAGPPPTDAQGFINFYDTVNNTDHAGAACPSTDTCYNTTYYYYVTATALDANNQPNQGPASNRVNSKITHLFAVAV